MNLASDNQRLYAWAPRSEVVFLQACFDAHENLGRIRTERHSDDGTKSLLLILFSPTQYSAVIDFLRQINLELSSPIEFENAQNQKS